MVKSSPRRNRRTDEQLIADLQAKIAQVKRRAEQRRARADPALRHIGAALRSIGKAESETKDPATRQALDEARATLSACLSLNRAAPTSNGGRGEPRGARADRLDAGTVLDYVRRHAGQRGEQIAAGLGTDTAALRPVMRKLIEDEKIRTQGQRRGMTYYPA